MGNTTSGLPTLAKVLSQASSQALLLLKSCSCVMPAHRPAKVTMCGYTGISGVGWRAMARSSFSKESIACLLLGGLKHSQDVLLFRLVDHRAHVQDETASRRH